MTLECASAPSTSLARVRRAFCARNGRNDGPPELGARRHEQYLRVRAVLGLREQVRGDERGVGAGVRDHEHLGRARGIVARGACRIAIHLRLRFRDPGVAGAENLVDFRHALGAVRHRRDGLRAAELEHALDTGDSRRVEHGRVDASRRLHGAAENSRRAARDARRHAEHERRRGERGIAGRHVEPDALDRPDHPLAAHAARRVDGERARQLRAMERLDVRRGRANRGALRVAQRRFRRRELLGAHLAALRARRDRASPSARAARRRRRCARLRDDLGDARGERRVVAERGAREQPHACSAGESRCQIRSCIAAP